MYLTLAVAAVVTIGLPFSVTHRVAIELLLIAVAIVVGLDAHVRGGR